jgi:hypothetical protein
MLHTIAMRQLHPKGQDMLQPTWKMRLTNLLMADGPGRGAPATLRGLDRSGFWPACRENSRRLLEARRPGPRGIPLTGHLASAEAE